MEKILTLRDALVAKLTAMSKPVTARYVPYPKRADVIDGRWIIALQDEENDQKRNVDNITFTMDLVYQRALPDPTDAQPVPTENNTFLDACIEERGTIASLFREGGALRGACIGGCVQTGLPRQPFYLPDHLINHSMFCSVVRVEFRYENES